MKDTIGPLDGVTLREAVEAARPAKLPSSQLPCHALLRWTEELRSQLQIGSLAASAPFLRDVWAKKRISKLYFVPGRTLGPLLDAEWTPRPHQILEQKSTKELFEACASSQEEQYFYSGLAEGISSWMHAACW
ncbi:ppm2 [Symbiodinium pilosum]|uniref:Ppm2 protein n=1 Tax=Symbiodinium pilosum TaxID=2952 RepID=A0A812LEI2_SYMPI|nr:ppm2 [Symbiodinium pilosum]